MKQYAAYIHTQTYIQRTKCEKSIRKGTITKKKEEMEAKAL